MLLKQIEITEAAWEEAWERALEAGAGLIAERARAEARAAGLRGREAALAAAARAAEALRDVLDAADVEILTRRTWR
jgi:hypothetical protein